jgi:sugar phosphate isomerase/epimerase
MVEYFDNFYKSGYSSFSPEYGNFTGYKMNFSDIGTSLDARTADQVKEVSKQLNTGIKTVEVAAHSPEVFDAMPKDQFKEINRMSKLLKIEPTMHAPMVDPTGITEQGWSELNQELAKRQLLDAVTRGQELRPDGNVVITMHASTVGLPPTELKIKEGNNEKVKSMLFINPQGKLGQIKEEDRYFPEEGEKFTGEAQKFNPIAELKRKNKDAWLGALQNVTYYTDFAERSLDEGKIPLEDKKRIMEAKELKQNTGDINTIQPLAEKFKDNRNIEHGEIYLKKAYEELKGLFDMAYKNAESEDKKLLRDYANEMTLKIKDYSNFRKNPEKIHEFAEDIEKGARILGDIKNPKIFSPLTDFAREKSAETFGDIAFESYKKFKDKSPIISIENHPAGQSLLTTGEDLKEVIEKAQRNFVEKATLSSDKGGLGLSTSEAKQQAKKLIGATWDVGHINMLRKYGYTEKDIIKETEKVAKHVKHVHLSDNFGFEHTELPMGMGNVPIKEIMQRLGKEGFKGKKVAEALSWWQHFSNQGVNSAIVPTMQAFGSPVFSNSQGGPGWNNSYGTIGNYFGFPMAYMPEKHFSLYGSGFSSLPQELGGQIPGTNSRFSGTPNA